MADELNTEYLLVRRGDTFRITLQFTDKITGDVIDITDCIIRFTVKSSVNDLDSAAVIKKDITVHTNPTAGETVLTLTSTDTNLNGKYLYDVQFEDPSVSPKDVFTILSGIIEFSKDITIRTTS